MNDFIDWNDASALGLIREINSKVLHPLGLAMARNPTTGSSNMILVSDDGTYEYAASVAHNVPPKDNQELMKRISELGINIKKSQT